MEPGLVALIVTAVGWASREIWRHRQAKRQAASDAGKILSQKKTLLEDMISKTPGTNSTEELHARLDEVNAALLGLHAERLRHTLKQAGLPTEEALIADGRSRLQPRESVQIEEIVEEIRRLTPSTSTHNLLLLGDAYYRLQKYEEAKNVYSKILDLNPYDHIAIRHRGATYIRMKKYEEAIADFNRSLEINPGEVIAIHDRGVAFRRLKKYQEAFSDFNRALEIKADHPTILLNRGAVLWDLKRYEEALVDLNRSLELETDNSITLTNRGITYGHLGRYEEALVDLNRSLELEPDDPNTLYNLACLFSLWGKPDDALACLEKAIKGDEKHREMAKTDNDFDNIREGSRFKKLIESD